MNEIGRGGDGSCSGGGATRVEYKSGISNIYIIKVRQQRH